MNTSIQNTAFGKSAPAIKAHGGMVLWALIVGLSFPIVGHLNADLPPLTLTALRFLIATLAMLPFMWGNGLDLPESKGLLLYMLMGLCLAAFFASMFWVAHRTTALTMSAIYVTVPVSAFGIGILFGVENRDWKLFGLLILGAAGALLLVRAENAQGTFGLGGPEALFFVGCTASALYPVLSKFGLRKGWLSPSPTQRTTWSLAFGCVLIAALACLFEPVDSLAQATTTDLLLITYLGVFSSGATFWLMQSGTNALTPSVVTAYSYLVPFVSLLLLFVDGSARQTTGRIEGSVLILLAITLLVARDARRQSQGKGRPKTR